MDTIGKPINLVVHNTTKNAENHTLNSTDMVASMLVKIAVAGIFVDVHSVAAEVGWKSDA